MTVLIPTGGGSRITRKPKLRSRRGPTLGAISVRGKSFPGDATTHISGSCSVVAWELIEQVTRINAKLVDSCVKGRQCELMYNAGLTCLPRGVMFGGNRLAVHTV